MHWEADQIEVVNTRYRGPNRGGKRFAIALSPLFVWAGVYAAPYQAIPEHGASRAITGNLLVLHGVTRLDNAPDIYAGTRRIRQQSG